MRLEAHHKEFVVECYAKFMTRADIVETFVEMFPDYIEELCVQRYRTRDDYIQSTLESNHKSRFSKEERIEIFNEEYDSHIEPIIVHLKRKLSTQIRRFHIDHPQFPKKYIDLFNNARQEHLNKNTGIGLHDMHSSLSELEDLYNNVKRMIYVENQISILPLAHNILRTIIACQLTDEPQDILDITPKQSKMIENNSNNSNEIPEQDLKKQHQNQNTQN